MDVETDLPPKKEYVLYAPLSVRQRELYDAILRGGLRAMLMKVKGSSTAIELKDMSGLTDEQVDEKVEKDDGGKRKTRNARRRKSTAKKTADPDGDDDEYFRKLENGELEQEREKEKSHAKTEEEAGREWQYKAQREFLRNGIIDD